MLFFICFLQTPKCLLLVRILFAYAFYTHHCALYQVIEPSAFYIGLEHTPEFFLHMLFTRTKVLFTCENAFCICFLHTPLILLHTTWPKCFLHRTWTHTRILFTYAFYKHQSAFYKWECFLHMLFTRTTNILNYDLTQVLFA